MSLCILLSIVISDVQAVAARQQAARTDGKEIRNFSVSYIRDGIAVTYGNDGGKDTSEMIFEAGSNGKMIAAYLCLKLQEAGKLALDDKITAYLDKRWITNDARFSEITVRHLLSHTAGFSPSFELGVDKKIYFNPGSHFSYSGVGYIYLQKVIEDITGKSFEDAAQAYVFQPLKMTSSTFSITHTVTPYVDSSAFFLYTCVVWLILGLVIYSVAFLMGLLLRIAFFKKQNLFYFSIASGFILLLLLLTFILPRMVVPALILGAASAFLLIAARKREKSKYLAFLLCIATLIISGMLLHLPLPIGPVLSNRPPNAAYSLNTCTKDMTLFAEELLKIYNTGSPAMKEMFVEQTRIDAVNGWGAGIAIEHGDKATTYWHSGINPGMQSLFVLCPDLNRAVIVMTNSDSGLGFAKKKVRDLLGIHGTWDIVRTDLAGLR